MYKKIVLLLAILVISLMLEHFKGIFMTDGVEGYEAKKNLSEQEIKDILLKDPKVKQMLENGGK